MTQKCRIWDLNLHGLIIILTISIPVCDAQCSQDINGVYRFGQGCGFLCHCLNSEQCDVNTGECATGCDFDWVGPACQHKNIAVEGISRHLDNIVSNLYGARANDRELSTCSYTAEETTYGTRTRNPWWRLWLPYTFTLRKMDILTIDSHRKYFNGFKVIVENVPESKRTDRSYYPDQSQICYTHSDTSLESISMTVTCDRVYSGNQVRIELSNKKTQLVLCDVRIYGDCAENVCGYDCNKLCYCKDITAYDKVSGTCSNGCSGRWSGSNGTCDTECANNMWGETCDIQCGHCRFGAPCDVVTGKCPLRCEDGYKETEQCIIECDDGTYGLECQSNCSGNCKNNAPCNKTDGHCSDGCGPGYTGEMCSYRCPQGLYGNDCKDKCSDNCNGGLSFCSNVDGICSNGCKSGYKGNLCNLECETGRWGVSCATPCGMCLTGTCNNKYGICMDWTGCKAGYTFNPLCNQECEDGTYGLNCTEKCTGTCAEVCDKESGTCASCKAGWKGQYCNTECSETEWGMNCKGTCGKCKDGHRCNRVTGTCSGGCILGYKTTLLCNDECEDGTYGVNCFLRCGSCQTNSVCNKTTGVCHEGCSEGLTGDMCLDIEETAEATTTATTTETTLVIAVIVGVGAAIIIVIILGVLAILWYLRKKLNRINVYKQESRAHGGMAMSDISSESTASGVKPTDRSRDTYDTLQVGNVDEHQYEL